MAVPGREPDPNSINRNKPTVDWTEVEDKPYTGKRPKLPVNRTVMTGNGPMTIPFEQVTKDWWETVTKLPHCKHWGPGDWQFALTTFYVAEAAHTGTAGAWAELRRREDQMGVTAEARRKLRIRYVPATKTKAAPKTTSTTGTATVTHIDERRQRQRQAS